MKIHYNSNFRADSTNGSDSSLESAPALFFNGFGGSDSGLKQEGAHEHIAEAKHFFGSNPGGTTLKCEN